MSTEEQIQKIQRYIDRTKIPHRTQTNYSMCLSECFALKRATEGTDVEACRAIVQAFDFGMAKGYRAAKAEIKK